MKVTKAGLRTAARAGAVALGLMVMATASGADPTLLWRDPEPNVTAVVGSGGAAHMGLLESWFASTGLAGLWGDDSGAGAGDAAPAGGYTFEVTADPVSGLYPGATRQLNVTLRNPYGRPMTVTGLTATLDPVVGGGTGRATAQASTCQAIPANLTMGERTGPALPIVVGARSTEPAGSIPLYMPDTVDNACQGVTFTIHLRGTAARESGK